MNIIMNGKETEVKFSFNSFKYMQDFDMGVMDEIEHKPFKIIPLVEMLLLGGLNYDPKHKFTYVEVLNFLEEYVVENSIGELLENLVKELEGCNFFKSLQKNQEKEVVEVQ